MEALLLARIQFAANISFHILFPTITIALGWVLLYFRIRANRSDDPGWIQAYQFWVKVFALSFAMGVVSGITMSFQFGTNWPGFMETVGNVAGPLLAYEVLTAFFLEAGFLGIMLFGATRVSKRIHTLATFLVAFGTTLSAFWILVLNSWMHTPAGFEVIDGVVFATDWWAIVFNPSMPYRFMHTLAASALTVSFLLAGISSLRWLWNDTSPGIRKSMRTGVFLAAAMAPTQMFLGDIHGLNTLEHQPAKVAAMEANWDTRTSVPAVLFSIPNDDTRRNDWAVTVPSGASLVLTHTLDGAVPALNDFVTDDGEVMHPPVKPVFFAFRLMIGVGITMLLVSWWTAPSLIRHNEPKKLQAIALVGMTLSGWVATLAGWYVTEIGRQPWLVTGVLDTASAVGAHPAPLLGLSLSAYLFVYAALLSAYIYTLYHLAKKNTRQWQRTLDPGQFKGAVAGALS